MKTRAIFISLLLHLAPVALFLFFTASPGLRVSEVKTTEEPLVEAPMGDVFVVEQASEAPAPQASPTEFPSEVKQAEAHSSSSAPGLPDGEAHPVGRIEPSYPPLSRNLGEEGEAAFQITVEESGKVSEVSLEKTSGFDRLDEAAKAALLSATFEPARREGHPVLSRKRFRVEFRLGHQHTDE